MARWSAWDPESRSGWSGLLHGLPLTSTKAWTGRNGHRAVFVWATCAEALGPDGAFGARVAKGHAVAPADIVNGDAPHPGRRVLECVVRPDPPPMSVAGDGVTSPGRVARGATWSLIDQVISSLTNFALGIAIAHVGTTTEFAVYGLAFGAYLISINIARPVSIEPLIIRFTGRSTVEWRAALEAAIGIVLLVGAGLGAVAIMLSVLVSVVVGSSAVMIFAILGIGLPALVLQDAWRLSFFAEGRGYAAAFNDLCWAVIFFGVIGLLAATNTASAEAVMAGWVGGGVVAAGLGLVVARVRPRWSRRWWTEQKDLAWPLLGEHVATNVLNELTPYAIGAVAGLAAVAALRAGQLLLGPFNLFFQALGLIALPEAVRIAARSRPQLLRAIIGFTTSLVVAVLVVGLVVSAAPTSIGSQLLGSVWPIAQTIILPYTLFVAAGMFSAGPMLGLRALGEAGDNLRVGVIRSTLAFGGAIVGAVVGGAPVAALGMALGSLVGGIAGWRAFVHALGRRAVDATQAQDPPTVVPERTRST